MKIHSIIKEVIHILVPNAPTKIRSLKEAYEISDKILLTEPNFNNTHIELINKKFPSINISFGEILCSQQKVKINSQNGDKYEFALNHAPILSYNLNQADKKPQTGPKGRTKIQIDKISLGNNIQEAAKLLIDESKKVGFEIVKKYALNPKKLRNDIAKIHKDLNVKYKDDYENMIKERNEILNKYPDYNIFNKYSIEAIKIMGNYIESQSKINNTKVQFFYNVVQFDVFAFFPDINHDVKGTFKTSYSHIGQHSSCHPDYIKECIPATPEQVKPLKQELESIGYKLEII
jgi:hypothetical protein